MDDMEADELPVADEARTFTDPSPAHLRLLKSEGLGGGGGWVCFEQLARLRGKDLVFYLALMMCP